MTLSKELQVLIIEDNLGDFILFENLFDTDLLKLNLKHAQNFQQAGKFLENERFDIIFLDLSLPDARGNELVSNIVRLADTTPVLVLTGYADKQFGVEALSMGVSDYLLKDELTRQQLTKSILYSLERSKITNKLKESEEKYRAIFHSSPLPMWVYDIETFDFLDVNEAAIRYYEFSQEEFLSMNFRDLIPDNSKESIDEILRICNNTEGFIQTFCYHRKKTKEIIEVEIQSNEIEFEKQKARLILAHDVTQKNRAEEALKHSERRFKALVQKGSDVFSILDPKGKYQYVGSNSISILGVSPKDFENKKMVDFIHPEDVPVIQNSMAEILNSGQSIQIPPYRFRIADNSYIWLETIITDMCDDPSVAGIVANSKNITDKIENDLKLKISIERYNIVSKATSDVIWDWDLMADQIIWNNGLNSVFGYPEDNMQTSAAGWYNKIHPDDLKRVKKSMEHHINQCKPFWQEEYRFRCADGSYKYIFDRGFLSLDENGFPQRFIGAMQDISKLKKEEHRLKLFESIVINSTDAAILMQLEPLHELDAKITYINDAFIRLTGYRKEEVVGNTMRFLKTIKIPKSKLLFALRALRNYQSFELELVYTNRSMENFLIQLSMTPVADSTNQFTHWVAIFRDITEKTKKELEITKAIIGAQEVERYEIGCELHDNINQILSATQLALGMTYDETEKDPMLWVGQASKYIDIAIDEIRRLSHRLAPNSLDDTTFFQAVNSLCTSLNVKSKMNMFLDIDSDHLTNISADVQLNLYRIIQEQLNNIVKHSNAENVTIKSELVNDTFVLSIEDDGKGFNINRVQKGIGLNNIVKRGELIKGRLTIKSSENEGCIIKIKIDLKN